MFYKKLFKGLDKKNENNSLKSQMEECERCNIIVPKSLQVCHCYHCDLCVIGQDHHCVWLGKCIGKNNWISFYAAMVSLPLFLIFSFLTLVMHLIYLCDNNLRSGKKIKGKFF